MSEFIVSARKYRPQRFDEVVGQEHVTQTLKNALSSDHLAHAFLFCGPRGVGKTTCARILAKTINCENIGDDFEPCNACTSCTSLNENASFNIIEQDGASNNKVDDIRELINQVSAPPARGKYKVFIIDEVHMLSQAAFNAFLKTLEEPPAHAIFILATTEKHKILPTILSRCQIYDFKPIKVERIKDHLQAICTQENIEAEDDALHLIGQKADGALRDALSLFDRIVSATTGKLTYQSVIENLNILDYENYFQINAALMQRDFSAALSSFNEILAKGFEPDQFLEGMIQHIRDLLMAKEEKTIPLLNVGENIKVKYLEQSRTTELSFLLSALQILLDTDVNITYAGNKKLHVELALCKLSYLNQTETITPLDKKKVLN